MQSQRWQCVAYLGEDDIMRFEGAYGRDTVPPPQIIEELRV